MLFCFEAELRDELGERQPTIAFDSDSRVRTHTALPAFDGDFIAGQYLAGLLASIPGFRRKLE